MIPFFKIISMLYSKSVQLLLRQSLVQAYLTEIESFLQKWLCLLIWPQKTFYLRINNKLFSLNSVQGCNENNIYRVSYLFRPENEIKKRKKFIKKIAKKKLIILYLLYLRNYCPHFQDLNLFKKKNQIKF